MTLQQITADDIAGWDSLDEIAASFEELGLERRPSVGEKDEIVLQLADTEFIKLVEADSGESASDHKPEGNWYQRTNFVATNDYDEFTFLTYDRDRQHGRQKYRKLSFTKEQMTSESGEKHTILQKLNRFEHGSNKALRELYDTKKVVEDFYEEFEELRIDLVDEVTGIPDDRENAKERYVQVIFDRLIFLYFIQEKRLLDTNTDYLHEKPAEVAGEDGDHYEKFYKPLFFDYLAEDKDDVENFGDLPYLNGGLFSKSPVEEEFEDARLGDGPERTNELFGEILDFLSDWNWNVAEHLDIADPKNLSPAILGHIFERTVNQKEMGAYYTPEEITSHMAEETIHPNLLDRLNELVDAEYDEIDEVFSLSGIEMGEDGKVAVADGGMTQQAPVTDVDTNHVETLYHDVLKETKVLDPAVGSGAFLLAAQEVLLDIYIHCIEHFQRLIAEEKVGELSGETRDEIEAIRDSEGNETLYIKREIVLNNLYGVDIDEGAVEICKLRLWLSMVADIEGEPDDVEPLPNIDFNIRSGDSLIGFESTEVAVDGQRLLIAERLKEDLEEYRESIKTYKSAEKDISQLRSELDALHDELQAQLNEWFADLPDIKVEDDIFGPEELQEIISVSNEDVKLKLKFADPINDDLDQELNDLGFRTWKKAANLEMGNHDVRAGKPEKIFDKVPADQLTRSFVERGLLKKDINQLDPFHWVMEFPDAYDAIGDGDKDDAANGFDVVLENPPYVRIESVDELQRDIYKDLHETATGRCDLYVPFIERSFEILNKKGRNSIITSNLFMKTEYGESVRQFLPQNYGLERIVDFTAYSPFDEVTIYSTILFGSMEVGTSIDCVSVRSANAVDEVKSTSFDWDESDDIVEFTLSSDVLGADRWLILTDEERSAREKVRQGSDTTLSNEELFTVGSPLKTGQNTTLQADIVAEEDEGYTIENSRISGTVKPGIWKRIITPDYVNRWNVSKPEEVTFFPYEAIDREYELIDEDWFESEYTTTYELLEEHKEKLLSRKDSRRTWKQLGRPWYSLARIGSPDYFEETKVVTDIVVNEPHFCIDKNGYLFSTGFIHGITPHEDDPYYLTGLLNTRAIFSYLKPICPPKNNGYMKMEVEQLKAAPVYLPDIREELCAELNEMLEEHKGDYEELEQLVKSQNIGELVNSSEEPKMVAANMLREVSRNIIEEYESLSDDDIEQLEKVNDRLSGILFDLDEKELEALYHI
ncbi:Eco57I restriction-modification methylase domain-containing protein [Halosimplex halobium]|uniref:Eco57I restriction-modification methylase domain-containing protein n=1 Tax=Halosimplex halobium TaxID=3396618 RepID=UPI003F562574